MVLAYINADLLDLFYFTVIFTIKWALEASTCHPDLAFQFMANGTWEANTSFMYDITCVMIQQKKNMLIVSQAYVNQVDLSTLAPDLKEHVLKISDVDFRQHFEKISKQNVDDIARSKFYYADWYRRADEFHAWKGTVNKLPRPDTLILRYWLVYFSPEDLIKIIDPF